MAERAQTGDPPDIGDGHATAMRGAMRSAARLGGGCGETDERGRDGRRGNRSRNAFHALGSCLVGLPRTLVFQGRVRAHALPAYAGGEARVRRMPR